MVSEIIWNLPVAPRSAVQPEKWSLSTIGDAPMHDDIRVIVRHSPRSFHSELTYIPFLRGWSKRFRNKGTGKVIREQAVDDIVPERSVRDRMKVLSMTLLPWLVRLWPQEVLQDDSTENLEEMIAHLDEQYRGGNEPLKITPSVLSNTLTKPPSLLDLVMYRLPKTMDALTYQTMTAGKINSQCLYRSPCKLQSQSLKRVSKPLSIQDISNIEEGLEQEWIFGVKFESEDEDIQSWWMVIQDPAHTARMLVGCFIDRPPDKDGFLWAENKQKLLTQSSLDNILGYSQTVLIGRKAQEKLEVWMSKDDDEPVYAGVFEVKGQGRSTIGNLQAIRQTITEEPNEAPSFTIHPPESFYKRAVDSLRRYFTSISSPTPVNVHLEMIDDLCHVVLRDTEGNEVQDIPFDYTADLIALLRWPMVKGGPMFTDSGEYVTWSIFDDIDYGELDFIAPYVTYTAARKTPAELPKSVSQFLDESRSLSVSLAHDASVCPIISGTAVEHDSCWRIELPSNCPTRVRKQLDRPLTGEEVNGILAPGRLFTGRLYRFESTLPPLSEKDESIVFHEERYIRMLLRSKGLRLKRLPPGTFLHVPNQEWSISIGWDGKHFKWQAESTVSSLSFKGHDQTVELVHGLGAQEECDRLLNIITSQIPPAQIHEYSELEEQVIMGLRDRGYSKKSPVCELRIIERTEQVFRYGVFLVADSQSRPLESFAIEAGEGCTDTILEGITTGLNEGDASVYNIRNVEQFIEQLSSWVYEYIQEIEWESEEPSEYEVTLTLDDDKESIRWEVEPDGHKGGVLYDDFKILLYAGLREAIHQVREIFELDIVSQLGVVSNLEDVLTQQIPEMVRRIRQGRI
ncbi:anti-sigma factor [Candidatus Thorarchaeota archaeon]|nr:MAG: anti-sigma factor [Candidatus Thorarchaeota archaeon]